MNIPLLPTYSHPLILLLLPVSLLLVFWWRRRRGASLRYSGTDLFAASASGRSFWAWHGGWVLRGLALVMIIVALAGPRWPDLRSRLSTEGVALAMVVDVSGSMNSDDFLWDDKKMSRLDGMKKVFRIFIEGGQAPDGSVLPGRAQDLIALVIFARHSETACPATLDHDALLKILDKVQPRTEPNEATTNPGDAIAWALFGLKDAPTRRKAIIFLTDGESNVKEGLKPGQAAQLAGNLGIPIYAIDANPEANNDENAELDRKRLEQVARISHGQYFKATTAQALADVYAQIDRLERSTLETPYYSRYYEGFFWFSLSALASWLSLVFFESTLWRTIP